MKEKFTAFLASLFLMALLSTVVMDFNRRVDSLQSRLEESDRQLRRMYGEERRSLRDLQGGMTSARSDILALVGRMEHDVDALYRDVLLPSVQVDVQGGVGGGTVLSSTRKGTFVVTAFHVIQKAVSRDEDGEMRDPVGVKIYAGAGRVWDTVKSDILAYDEKKDLALLRLRTDKVYENVARLASHETLRGIKVFTPVYAVGCPLGHDPLPTLGEVASLKKELEGENFWMMSAPTIFGNSGGGVFHRETREMIGVSVMICTYDGVVSTPVPHLGVFISLEAVYDWLDSLDYGFVTAPDGEGAPLGGAVAPLLEW